MTPPGECDWTCASFGPLESTIQTANRSVQPFLHSSRQKVTILYNGHPYPPELPLPMGDLDSHLTHDALGPWEPTTQTASRSVQPCLHRWPQSVPILYNGRPGSPSKLPLHTGFWTPCNTFFIGPSESWTQFDRCSRFAWLTRVTDWHSDRQTDRPRYSVGNNSLICPVYVRSTAMRRNNA